MGYKLELNPEAFARTQQGGCVMTAIDTDTNIIEPFILKEGRASGRTAINRDGLLYDVLPYEPAMTLKDGVMVLSEEPLRETLIFNSGWKGGDTPTNWSVAFNGGTRTSSLYNSELDLYKLTFRANTGRNSIYRNISFVSGNFYNLSVYCEYASGGSTVDNVIRLYGTGNLTYYKNGEPVLASEVIESGNFYSVVLEATANVVQQATVGVGVVRNSTGLEEAVLTTPQVEEGTVRTSFIISPIGATGVRLGATGVTTPDISKYINRDKVSMSVSCSVFSAENVPKRIGLYNNNTDAILFDFANNVVRIFVFVNNSLIDNITIPASVTNVNTASIELEKGKNITYKLNETEVFEGDMFNGFSKELSTVSFTTYDGITNPFRGDIKNITIES